MRDLTYEAGYNAGRTDGYNDRTDAWEDYNSEHGTIGAGPFSSGYHAGVRDGRAKADHDAEHNPARW